MLSLVRRTLSVRHAPGVWRGPVRQEDERLRLPVLHVQHLRRQFAVRDSADRHGNGPGALYGLSAEDHPAELAAEHVTTSIRIREYVPDPAAFNTDPAVLAAYLAAGAPIQYNCYQDGEAALPIKMELARGPVTVSLIGYGLTYNTLDNNRSPTSGLLVTANQDVAVVSAATSTS